MNTLPIQKRCAVVHALCEGNSIRATARLTGVSKTTISKMVVELGMVCSAFQDDKLRNLATKRVQLDEIWAFVGMKQKSVPEERKGEFGVGDIWTWTAIDADTRLVVTWAVGGRDKQTVHGFARDMATRFAGRVQITTDAYKPFIMAIREAFGERNVDYAVLRKYYGPDTSPDSQRRYSPPVCVGVHAQSMFGYPDLKHVSTSYVERSNLTIRMSMRRFTRLTNGFSKKALHHAAAVSLYFMFYNFCRVHQTLRVTPAMEAGVADHIWTLEELVSLLPEPTAKKRGPYKKGSENSN